MYVWWFTLISILAFSSAAVLAIQSAVATNNEKIPITRSGDLRKERRDVNDKDEAEAVAEIDCWWTGCHSELWKVRGCEQFGKVAVDMRTCKGGNEFNCCKTSKTGHPVKEISREATSIQPPEPQAEVISDTTNCWWTGCQNFTLNARGCEQFGRMATNTRACDGGDDFFCCSEGKEDSEAIAAAAHLASCWWTGCQNYSLNARGCKHFGREVENKKPCDGGDDYFCCPKRDKTPTTTEAPEPVIESQISGDCWWTGCQIYKIFAQGCEQFDRLEAGKKSCKGGDKYFCCAKPNSTTVDQILTDEAKEVRMPV